MALHLRTKLRRLLGIPQRYCLHTYRRREEFRPDYETVARCLLHLLEFESVLDVGCGNGFLLSYMHSKGKRVAGVDNSPLVPEVVPSALVGRIAVGDFTDATGRWDLVCCVEVAEHIPPRRSQELVTTLCAVAERWIYFTAAPPGQTGHGHINCRPHDEWLKWFADHGFALDRARTDQLRHELSKLDRAHWLRHNSLLLVRQSAA